MPVSFLMSGADKFIYAQIDLPSIPFNDDLRLKPTNVSLASSFKQCALKSQTRIAYFCKRPRSLITLNSCLRHRKRSEVLSFNYLRLASSKLSHKLLRQKQIFIVLMLLELSGLQLLRGCFEERKCPLILTTLIDSYVLFKREFIKKELTLLFDMLWTASQNFRINWE